MLMIFNRNIISATASCSGTLFCFISFVSVSKKKKKKKQWTQRKIDCHLQSQTHTILLFSLSVKMDAFS
jgi:hypothetical protein